MLSFNVEGLLRNRNYLASTLKTQQPMIVFLQEIWLPYADRLYAESYFPNYNMLISTPDMFVNTEDLLSPQSHVWQGVAILWRKDQAANITPTDSLCERIAGIKYKTISSSILLVSFYAPTSGHDDSYIEALSELSHYLKSNAVFNPIPRGL